ncbi:MAG: indole-3-glycerol phosphate synthase TrpC [Steroidobacteraceae bacterium]
MAESSRQRLQAARSALPQRTLVERCAALPPTLPPARGGRFDLIAELKLRSPALGQLAEAGTDRGARVEAYARSGACAVSVLTEPDRFGGSLEHLQQAAARLAPLGVLVDPYQLYAARGAGAGGALLIVRMLTDPQLTEMLDCARSLGLFILLETFDEEEVERAAAAAGAVDADSNQLFIGVNSRDLQTLEVVPERLGGLAGRLPSRWPRVAESGLETPDDAADMARAGYDLALVGGALMRSSDPAGLLTRMLEAGRLARA